ncbi:manganese efflux pump MntP family protein [Desulfotomaculum copahuensis]|uniref:Putative manganese efflux pump MntP n=1 Tax=Desulfotomaculum copahuensis TaxID=1838280 RepID=A0A1B7LB92_9FIRM|nr:manganese efflux pump MntP family protein [Desulfotomaculum copahuensis]OAT79773.1 manganese efflux pump MntP [Desulfotomaculum copahuensis]
MGIITVLLLALALGADAFSLCLGIGMAGIKRRQVILISLTVLLFHIIMPLAGFEAGELAGGLIGRAAAVAGALLMLYLGLRMVQGALRHEAEESPRIILVNGWGLFMLGASVSMDALSVGFTLGTQRINLLLTVLVFGLVAGLMTFSGLYCGRCIGRWAGERAQLLGGLILLGIGLKMIV